MSYWDGDESVLSLAIGAIACLAIIISIGVILALLNV